MWGLVPKLEVAKLYYNPSFFYLVLLLLVICQLKSPHPKTFIAINNTATLLLSRSRRSSRPRILHENPDKGMTKEGEQPHLPVKMKET